MNNNQPVNITSDTNNERFVVRELQHMLRYISRYNAEIPPLNPDGIFGELTEDAVKAFQTLYKLPVTGEVDLNTWNEIRRVFHKLREIHLPANPVHVYPPELAALSPNDTFDEVLILQIMLKKLADRYDNVPNVELSGVYDPKTQQAVINLQEIFKIDQTGKVDKQTWNHIERIYSSLTNND